MSEVTITPKIFIYEEGKVFLTPECMFIPEIKAIVDKYGEIGAIPYIGYIHLMKSISSPYRNYEDTEKKELVIYDVITTMGDFDINEPLLEPALDKLEQMNSSALTLFFLEIEQELHRLRNYLKDHPISAGKEGDLTERFRILKEAGALTNSYNKTKLAAEEELKIKGRGKAQIGDY